VRERVRELLVQVRKGIMEMEDRPYQQTYISRLALALDASGNIYIADQTNYRIRKVTVSKDIITTVAGTGNAGYSGDRGQATSAAINYPLGVCSIISNTTFVVYISRISF
jgi:hypothetical protein